MKFPKVAIITTTFNQDEKVEKCLRYLLKKTDYPKYKIYFLDDSGTGEIAKKVKKLFKKVDVSSNNSNLGYAISNNILMKRAIKEFSPDYILHVDDDTEILERDWLKKLINFAEKQEEFWIGGVKIIYPDGSLQWFLRNKKINFSRERGIRYDDSEEPKTAEVENVIGCFFLIKTKVIKKIGLFDEEFSPAYGEETDFCCRARKAGFKLFYFGKTAAIHHGSSSANTIASEKIWFIKKRNYIRLEWLNHNYFDILKYSMIHLISSLFKKDGLTPTKKISLLLKAYAHNIKNIKEILKKRNERRGIRY